jgi:hypothetical protein
MDSKIMEFIDEKNSKAELWGSLCDVPIKLAFGIAHAFLENDTLILSFYEPTGLTGANGDIKRLCSRIAIPANNFGSLLSHLNEIEASFRLPPATQSNEIESAQKSEIPIIGDRVF